MIGMSVLSDVDIRKITAKNKGIIISNICQENITAVGYDLTIGFICDCDTGKIPKKSPDSNRYNLLPKHRYLVLSKEYIYLSSEYMATLHSRGSYALKGIIVSPTTIDPNYKGLVYTSLFNCSENSVYIKEHNQFATMVIHKFATPTDKELPQNAKGGVKATKDTLNSPFSNICEQTIIKAKTYAFDTMDESGSDFFEQYGNTVKGKSVIGISIKKFVKKHRHSFIRHIKRFIEIIVSVIIFELILIPILKKCGINIDLSSILSLIK